MNKVYAVGVFQLDTSENARRPKKSERLWHLFANLEEAQEAVLKNRGDLFEYYYNYALIEEVYVIDKNDQPKAGEFAGFPREWWYFADFSQMDEDKNPKITEVSKPECFAQVVYFWVG
jgi:hypothetical protein